MSLLHADAISFQKPHRVLCSKRCFVLVQLLLLLLNGMRAAAAAAAAKLLAAQRALSASANTHSQVFARRTR